MPRTKDRIEFTIVVRGDRLDPEQLSGALAVKKSHAVALDAPQGFARSWWGTLESGTADEEGYEEALERTASFLMDNEPFFRECSAADQEVELVLGHAALLDTQEGDKLFELALSPKFLLILTSLNIGLRVEGWHWV